jgi:hypothetical protein
MFAGIVGLLFLGAPAARALGPVGIEVGALGGGGTNPSYAPTLLGFGVGGRAGVSWSNIYVGAGAIYYAGATSSATGVVDSTHTTLVGGQLGYTFKLGVLRVRPLLDLGVAEISEAGSTDSAFYVQPGFTLVVPIGLVYFGFDMNGLLVPSHARPCLETGCVNPPSSDVGLTLHGQVGVVF